MKIKTKQMKLSEVLSLPREKHLKPKRPNMFFRTLLKIVGAKDLKATNFKPNFIGFDKLGKDEPALFLMNHSSFIDLEIATGVLYPRPLNIVCTSDGFVGKRFLMRNLGCIPTKKFITDSKLVRDMIYTVKKLNSSILMYPEASYSFDGTATPLPESVGKCIKMLGVSVVMIKTYGAFARDPLYNMLQKRKVDVSADFEYLLSAEEVREKSAEEIFEIVNSRFKFDNFLWQQENKIKIDEPFRADGLNRVLYKCPVCKSERETEGKGTTLKCNHCGASWELDEYGKLVSDTGTFTHIPDWYAWERECVREELLNGSYYLDLPADIRMLVDSKQIYEIGEGRLIHDQNGFNLTAANGQLNYSHSPQKSYSLYSDFYWYELGDVICIGDENALYYCFPKTKGDFVAKTRLAAEELYKIKKQK